MRATVPSAGRQTAFVVPDMRLCERIKNCPNPAMMRYRLGTLDGVRSSDPAINGVLLKYIIPLQRRVSGAYYLALSKRIESYAPPDEISSGAATGRGSDSPTPRSIARACSVTYSTSQDSKSSGDIALATR